MKTSLSFGWSFLPGFDFASLRITPDGAVDVDLPHSVKLFSHHDFSEKEYQGEFTYIKTFSYDKKDRRAFLRFEGAMLQFDCYLNGVDLGHHIGGYLPVEIEVTDAIKIGKNRLVVRLDTREDPTVPPYGGSVDYLAFGGLYRPVYLIDKPRENAISSLFVHGDKDGNVSVTSDGDVALSCHVFDGEKEILTFEGSKGKLDAFEVWTPSNPKLYRLVASTPSDEEEVLFGFEDRHFTGEGFFEQGKKRKLLGLNRHQTFPYIGAAATSSLQKEDARILKSLGIDLVRTSHYADDESFLSECDRLGLYVIDEIPGWQTISKDPLWRSRLLDFTRRLVEKERNHPCLLAYGVRVDESKDDHELYAETNRIAHEADPYRPTIGVRNFKDSECLEDIYGYNDFSCSDLTHGADPSASLKGAKGKAKLITEHNGHMFPTKKSDSLTRQTEHALRHALVIEEAFADPSYAGAIGWCAFDYATHRDFGSLDHVCYHGVCDLFRARKLAGDFYASQGDEPMMRVNTHFCSFPYDGASLPKPVVFTNADRVDLYRNGEKVGSYYPDFASYPHLKHPPIILSENVGENFAEEGLSKHEEREIKKILNGKPELMERGLSFSQLLFVGAFMMKHKVGKDYFEKLYYKYIGSWGTGNAARIEVKAYKDGQCFASQSFGPVETTSFLVTPSSTLLRNGDTYDMASILVEKADQFGNRVDFADDSLVVETEGPIALLSPKVVSLVAGDVAIYVRSLPVKKETPARIIIHHREGILEVPLTVC